MLTLTAPRSEKSPHREEWRHSNGRLTRFLTRPPFRDALGDKGWFSRLSRAMPHVVHHLSLKIAGWPRWSQPMRIAFISDFHTGSHSADVARLDAIIAEASSFQPDLALFGGDYVNMQLFGGGRVPPSTIAAALARLHAPLGRFAVLGNHDYEYGARDVASALKRQKINVLSDSRATVRFGNNFIDIVGVPNARTTSLESRTVLAGIEPITPTIVLAHDPAWFAHVPPGPHLTLAGHTHGGQIRIPGIGVITNASKAPLRWSNGLISERGKVSLCHWRNRDQRRAATMGRPAGVCHPRCDGRMIQPACGTELRRRTPTCGGLMTTSSNGITSHRGSRYGYPFGESFIGLLARSRVAQQRDAVAIATACARAALDAWRSDYNHDRPHSRLSWQSPATYAAQRRSAALHRRLRSADRGHH